MVPTLRSTFSKSCHEMVSKMVSSSLCARAECNENPDDRIFTCLGDLPTTSPGINLYGKVRVGDDRLPISAQRVSSISRKSEMMNLITAGRTAGFAVVAMMIPSMTSLPATADTATLRVSIEGGSFNSRFKFFDASEGCPSYHDIPGAKDFLGGVRASDKGADKKLNLGQPVHVFMFRPKDYPGISAAGLFTEIRRRALEVVLRGDAELRYTGFEDHVPTWEAAGEIEVQPGSACNAGSDESEFGTGAGPEQELDGDAS